MPLRLCRITALDNTLRYLSDNKVSSWSLVIVFPLQMSALFTAHRDASRLSNRLFGQHSCSAGLYITLSFVSHNDGLLFVDIEGMSIRGWRREQDVAHQSCNEVDEHGGAASGDFFLSHIADNVCRVLISGRTSTAGKALAFTASKAEIDRGCKGNQEDSENCIACWWGEEEAKKGLVAITFII